MLRPYVFPCRFSRRMTDLKRSLRLTDGLAMVVGMTVGAGIFRTPGIVAARLGRPGLTFVVWVLGAGLAFLGALCFAELTTRQPRAAGKYAFVREAFGTRAGFVVGWVEALGTNGVAIAAIGVAAGEFLVRLLGWPLALIAPLGAGLVALFTGINLVGVGTVGAERGDGGEAARAGRRGGDRVRAGDGGGLARRAARGAGWVGCVGRDRTGSTSGHLDLLRLPRSGEDRRRGGGPDPHAAAHPVGRARRHRGSLSRAQRCVPPGAATRADRGVEPRGRGRHGHPRRRAGWRARRRAGPAGGARVPERQRVRDAARAVRPGARWSCTWRPRPRQCGRDAVGRDARHRRLRDRARRHGDVRAAAGLGHRAGPGDRLLGRDRPVPAAEARRAGAVQRAGLSVAAAAVRRRVRGAVRGEDRKSTRL